MFSLEGGETRTKQEDFIVVNRRARQSLRTISLPFYVVSPFENFVVSFSMRENDVTYTDPRVLGVETWTTMYWFESGQRPLLRHSLPRFPVISPQLLSNKGIKLTKDHLSLYTWNDL